LRNGRWAEIDRDGKFTLDQIYSDGVLVVDQLKKAAEEAEKK
jgi:hypothetical protein